MKTALVTLIFAAVCWAFLWEGCVHADRAECKAYGLAYGKTTILLDGYCITGRNFYPARELAKWEPR